MSSEGVKSCPFCGSDQIVDSSVYSSFEGDHVDTYECKGCHSFARIEQWNNRYERDALSAELAALKAASGEEVEQLRKGHDLAWDTAGTILEKLSKANVEVDRLAAALEQYADDGNWCYDTCNISRDVAKEALAARRQASQQEGE